jgi:LuxR family transcriptional regulator, maltose regulon positive regulatory protein
MGHAFEGGSEEAATPLEAGDSPGRRVRRARERVGQPGRALMPRGPRSDAKITRPELAEVYIRPRLIRALEPASGRAGVFVHAPAGYGKTTLLASYLQVHGPGSLWYRIDSSDADPASFFYHLGLAGRRAAGRRKLPLFTADQLPSLRAFGRAFFGALLGRLGPSGCLVLDDYHHLPLDSPLHALIAESLSMLAPGVQIVVAGRSPPPAPFAGLIANRQLHRLDAESLRLTAQECRGLLRLHGVRSGTHELAERWMRLTEGWVAGVILLLQARDTLGTGLAGAGDEPPGVMFDYFAGEVFERLDAETQRFLVETSFLSQMTVASCQRLTECPRTARILSELADQSCFTYRYRRGASTYLYHALFRSFLQARAREALSQERLRSLALRAAELESAEGRLDAAAALYAQAGDADALEALICAHAPLLVAQGRVATLRGWVEAVPGARRRQSPWLQYWLAQSMLPSDGDAARSGFEEAFALFQPLRDTRGLLMAWCGVVDTYVYRWDRFAPLDPWIAWLDEWLKRGEPFPDAKLEGDVACSMASALFYRKATRGDVASWFQRAWSVAQSAGDPSLLVKAAFSCVGWNVRMGAFEKSRIMLDVVRRAVPPHRMSPMTRIVLLHCEAMIGWMDTDPEAFRSPLREAHALAASADFHLYDAPLHSLEAYYPLALGDPQAADPALERMAEAIQRHPHQFQWAHYHFLRAWQSFVARDFKRSVECCRAAFEAAEQAGSLYAESWGHAGLALALFEDGRVEEARQTASRAVEEARRVGSPLMEYYTRFAAAYIALGRGRSEAALSALRAALGLGRSHGFEFSAMWWHPPMLEAVFSAALDADIEPAFVKASIRRHGFVPETPPLACRGWPWPVEVRTLGGFALTRSGQPVAFGRKAPRKPLELLKLLIALGESDVSEAAVIDALWPDSAGDAGRSALSTTVGRLRRIVGEEVVSVVDGRIGLDSRRCWTDVRALEAILSRAEAAEEGAEFDLSERLTAQAIDLYRGPFLSAEGNATWAIATRQRLCTRLLAAIGARARGLCGAGQWADAVTWYERGLEIEPLAEELYQGLMLAYRELGRRGEAVRAYERCRETLERDLGVEPSGKTTDLYLRAIDG